MVEHEKLKEKEILPDTPDISELLRVSNGDKVFVRNMIEIFNSQSEKALHNIKCDLENKNHWYIRNEAHRILGPSRHLRLENISLTIQAIELACERKESMGKLKYLIDKLTIQLDLIKKELDQVLVNLPTSGNEAKH